MQFVCVTAALFNALLLLGLLCNFGLDTTGLEVEIMMRVCASVIDLQIPLKNCLTSSVTLNFLRMTLHYEDTCTALKNQRCLFCAGDFVSSTKSPA